MFFNKKLPFVYLLIAGSLVWLLFLSNSGGSPGDYSGRIGSSGTCANCHGGGEELGSVTLTGAPTTYVNGATYVMSLTVNDPSALQGGFIVTAANSANAYIGTFTQNLSMGVKVVSGYSTHNAKKVLSGGQVTWPIVWKAPATGNALVKFYWVGNAVNNDGGSGGDSVYPDESPAFIALPLELTSFSVEALGAETLLKWQTTSEKNTDYFKILRSENGVDFDEIGKVTALNSISEDNDYLFSDTDLTGNAQTFYKLQIFDKDGTFNFSPIKSVKNARDFSIKIYPTLISKNTPTAIFIEQKNNVAEVQIMDVSGKICTQFLLEKGENRIEIDLDSGIYFLKIGSENKRILVY